MDVLSIKFFPSMKFKIALKSLQLVLIQYYQY